MKKNFIVLKKIVFFVIWILFSFISIIVSYWLIGALPKSEEGLSYGIRLVEIIQEPFGNHLNDYSPIAMVLAFIVNEIVFGIIYISKFSNNDKYDYTEEELSEKESHSSNEVDVKDSFEEKSIETNQPSKTADYFNDVKMGDDVSKEKKKNNSEETEKEFVLDDGIFLRMFNAGYDMNQITAMMELTQYIPKIDDIQLKKMFRPSMTCDQIRECIEVFYG